MLVKGFLVKCLGLLMVTSFVSAGLLDLIADIREARHNFVQGVKTKLEKAIVSRLFTDCESFEKKLGFSFLNLEDLKEQDLSKLKLDLFSGSETSVFKISMNGTDILNDKLFDKAKPVTIFIHGFMSSPGSSAAQEVTSALAKRQMNVLALDAGAVIKHMYLRSSTYVKFIGEHLGRVIATLILEGGVDPRSVHLVGHSLGAHISGFAGLAVQVLTGHKIGRITGLDPAGPCFFDREPELRLQASDADFVDVIHTDKGILGIEEPIGHVDFYPNNGEIQPGCSLTVCSHSRSWHLFSESILRPSTLPGLRCSSWNSFLAGECKGSEEEFMGYDTNSTARGMFFLKTAGTSPYGMGLRGINKTMDRRRRNTQRL